jgi:hypothetical protein
MLFRRGASGAAAKLPIRNTVEIEPRRVVRVGRNEPCPCGSGKKYKQCHESEGDAFLFKLARQEELDRLEEEQKRAGVPWFKRFLARALK